MSYTLLLFTAYTIVRTVPSANRPNRRKKKDVFTSFCIISRVLSNRIVKNIKSQPPCQLHPGNVAHAHCMHGSVYFHTSTSSEELNAQISPRTDDEHNLPSHEDYLQEHKHCGAHRNRNSDADVEKKATEHRPFRTRRMHMDNSCEYDDWKSSTERTLSVP